MALVGYLLAPSVSAKSTRRTSSAEPTILNSLTARNAGLWVKLLMDTVGGGGEGIKTFQTKVSGLLVTNFFQVSKLFCNKKTLKIFTRTSKNPSKSLKIL